MNISDCPDRGTCQNEALIEELVEALKTIGLMATNKRNPPSYRLAWILEAYNKVMLENPKLQMQGLCPNCGTQTLQRFIKGTRCQACGHEFPVYPGGLI